MQWIEQLKQSNVYDIATTTLGLTGGRLRTFGPCPKCNAATRGGSDPRMPVGTGRDGKGWQCHACSARGDVVELVSLRVLDRSSGELGGPEWAQLREWADARGLINPEDEPQTRQGRGKGARGTPRLPSVGELMGTKPVSSTSSALPTEPEEAEPAPPADGRLFSWDPTAAPAAASALWGDTAEAGQVRAYLLEQRKFSEASVRRFLLGLYMRDGAPVVGKEGRCYLLIPLMDQHGEVVNLRFRAIPKVGTCPHCSTPMGCKKCREYRVCSQRPMPLFNSHRLVTDTSVPVLVTEGELDVVAADTYGFTVNVVSGTAGAKTFTSRDDWLDLIEPYEVVVGLFDSDSDGEEGWKALAEKLGHYRTCRARLPLKDLGECLATGVEAEAVERAVAKAEPMHGMALRRVDEFKARIKELIKNPEVLRGAPTGSGNLDELMGGWRPGVVVVTGETGQGKTTFTTWAVLKQAQRGGGVVVTSFEQAPEGTVQKFLRMQVGRDFTQVAEEELDDAMGILGRLPLYILDHYGHISPAKLIEMIRYAKRRMGCRFFLVDHLGFLMDDDVEDERRAIEAVMRALTIVAKQMSVTIFLIVHPRNEPSERGGRYSRVTMKSIKGAAAIRQDADDVLIVVAELPDTAKGKRVKRPWPQSRIYADKVRSEFGVMGGDVALAFDPGSCIYADEWSETPAGKAGLLVPRKSKLAKHEEAAEAEKAREAEEASGGRRRPPRGGPSGRDAAAGDDRQGSLLRPGTFERVEEDEGGKQPGDDRDDDQPF